MHIRILGTESLGVRGMACVVEVPGRKIIIDPGISLDRGRFGLRPHPAQVAVMEKIREEILSELSDSTDAVFSHYHGDHVPLVLADPFQLNAQKAKTMLESRSIKIWAKGPEDISVNQRSRRKALSQIINRELVPAEEQEPKDPNITFSKAVWHGEEGNRAGKVIMTLFRHEPDAFVHASDIQFFSNDALDCLLCWNPTVVFAAGPPIYLTSLSQALFEKAYENVLKLTQEVDTLILDHHLLRNQHGLDWINKLNDESPAQVFSAADL